jgi:hypothetical protein
MYSLIQLFFSSWFIMCVCYWLVIL